MKICAHCDTRLRKGDDYTEDSIPSPSGPGTTIYRHLWPCKRTNAPTSQADLRH